MRSITTAVLLITLVLSLGAVCTADGPPQPIGDKLFGMATVDGTFPGPALAEAYEKSGFTAASVLAKWESIEPEPGSGKYDFSSVDSQPFAKSAKTRICYVSLKNEKAQNLASMDLPRYWASVDSFLDALVRHANAFGIKHFMFSGLINPPPRGEETFFAEALKHLHQTTKNVSKDNVVIVDALPGHYAGALSSLYKRGARGLYDVVALNAPGGNSAVDPFQLVAAHRELARNGEGDKKILVFGDARFAKEDYRLLLTERDIYDPAWVAGEMFGGVAATEAWDSFPPQFRNVSMTAEISAEGPVFSYITGKFYRLTVTVKNDSLDNITLGSWRVRLSDAGIRLLSKAEGDLPTSVGHGKTVAATFSVSLPSEVAGKQVTIVSSVSCTTESGDQQTTDNWLTLLVSPPYETTILPPRLILDPREGTKRVGMSVINHTDTEFDGKIALSTYPGITVSPAEFDTKIDPFGLEAFVYSVTPDPKAAPGHYAVFIDVGGEVKEWQAVDVPLIAKPSAKDCLDPAYDRNDAASFPLISSKTLADGATSSRRVGTGWISYTPQALCISVEVDQPNPVDEFLTIGFDVPDNGSFASGPGYAAGDYEFQAHDWKDQPRQLRRTRGGDKGPGPTIPFRLDRADGKSTFTVSLPWSEVSPLKPANGSTFALSLMVLNGGGSVAEFGGGLLGDRKDPRKFIPVVLAE